MWAAIIVLPRSVGQVEACAVSQFHARLAQKQKLACVLIVLFLERVINSMPWPNGNEINRCAGLPDKSLFPVPIKMILAWSVI